MSIHSVFGVLTILLIVIQVISGQEKLQQMDSGNKRVRRWHGDSGQLLWDLLCLTLLLGLMSFLAISFTNLLVLMIVLAAWMAVHVQMLSRSSLNKYDSAYNMEGESTGVARNDSFGTIDAETGLPLEGRNDDDNLITGRDGRDAADEDGF